MSHSVTGSVAGHVQLYSANHRDPLALFGTGLLASEDIGEIEKFESVKHALSDIDNIRALIPMGIRLAQVVQGNPVDQAIEVSRNAHRDGDQKALANALHHLSRLVVEIENEYTQRLKTTNDPEALQLKLSALRSVRVDGAWHANQDFEAQMLWLSQNVAPLHENSGVTFLRLLGTDPSAFESAFDRFRVTRGERLPVGRRGLMLSERVQETHFKHPVAHTFDQIERITRDDRNAITQDPNAADLKARLLSLTTKLGDDLGEHRSKVESSLAQALGVA
ncbi:MAG: hypothetical protein AAFQ82_26595, partial [Myxococcota bacterium]